MTYSSRQKQLAKALSADEALAKMEHFCAYRERCPQEVRRKMTELGIVGETAGQIYQVLEAEGYVDGERFARAFAGGKFRVNRWGRVRIRLELQRRDIPPEWTEAALALINEEEYLNVLQELLGKKRRQYRASGNNPQADSKAAAAMIRAGFEPELVFRFLQ